MTKESATTAEPGAPTVRGALIVGVRAWLRHVGDGYPADVRAQLSSGAAELLDDNSIINTSRVRADEFRTLCDELIALWGLEGLRGFHACTGFIALADLKGYMKVLVRVGTPYFVLNRFPRVWRHYFSHGELTVTKQDGKRVVVLIRGAGVYGDGALEGSVGWMKAAVGYSGARAVKVVRTSHPVEDCSEYAISWY